MKFRRRTTLSWMLLLAAIVATAIWAVPGSGASTPRKTAGATSDSVVLSLALSHEAALNRYVSGLYRAGSPSFHHFLTPAQFRSRFGASTQQVNAVLSRLRGLGYSSSTVSANHLYVTVSTRNGRRANLAGSLTSSLGSLVSGVITSADMPTLTPNLSSAKPLAATPSRSGSIRAGIDGGSTPCRAAAASGGYTSPALASAYNFNGLYADGFHGEGMSAAVVEFGGYHTGNIAAFSKCYGLNVPVSRVTVNGGAGAAANSSETEVALDIEVLLEMAPKLAHVYVYEAPNTGTGEIAAYNAFVTQDRAPVLSESWGGCEEGSSQSYQQLLATIEEEGVAQGQQMFVSAGDSGSKDCEAQTLPTGGSVSADTEDALPWATGVGGTDLSVESTKAGATVHREEVWNDGLGAGGGGQSVAWTMPSWQQSYLKATGDKPSGMADICGAPAGVGCRMEPDISMNADAEEGGADPGYWDVPKGPKPVQFASSHDLGSPGYAIYCASSDCSAGGSGWGRVGGTSAASPLAAAAAVLWDEQAKSSGVSLGFLNPELYALASNATTYKRDFYDVASGSNDDSYTQLSCLAGCTKEYKAGPGYDMATGLGALNVGNLGTDLTSAAGGVTVTPSAEHLYGYSAGGPTTTAPVSITQPTLADAGTGFTATSSASWLVVSSGASAPASLDWHVDPTGLAPGVYHGNITVTAADGSSTDLAVTYTVTPRAKIKLLTPSLHFYEKQVKIFGAGAIQTCGTPLWGDELEAEGTLPGLFGESTPGDEAPNTRRTLSFLNDGLAGSQLHFGIDQTNVAWVGNDLDPNSDPAGVKLTAGSPLVASQGTVLRGKTAGIKLASLANSNTVGGEPSLQQGTYHGSIVVRDLADPSDVARVPVTLTLGNGQGTPRIAVGSRTISTKDTPGQTSNFKLKLANTGACSYGYSISTTASWLSAGQDRHAGTVAAESSKAVTFIVSLPASEAAGTYHASIVIASVNAAQQMVRVPVTLTVG